jgi:N-hydroxyarylamine O-acetyltransferase
MQRVSARERIAEGFDLAGYLERIGYARPRTPTLSALRELHARHTAVIPFENIDPLMGRPVALDLPALQAKIVRGRRGGYCYEQNTLFAAALDALGFAVTRLAARVRWNAPPEAPEGPRTHMLLRADIAGTAYVADVGFGGYILAGPLILAPGLEQTDWGNRVRFVENDGRYTLQLYRSGGWHDIYRFTLEPQLPADFALGNWWTSTHPAALLTGNLLAERLTPEARFSLFNAKLTTRHAGGGMEERSLAGPDDLERVLTGIFAIEPPASPREIWARLPGDRP